MKIQPIASNHIHLHLDNGEILDINDGTHVHNGQVYIRLTQPAEHLMVVSTSTTYTGEVRLILERKQ